MKRGGPPTLPQREASLRQSRRTGTALNCFPREESEHAYSPLHKHNAHHTVHGSKQPRAKGRPPSHSPCCFSLPRPESCAPRSAGGRGSETSVSGEISLRRLGGDAPAPSFPAPQAELGHPGQQTRYPTRHSAARTLCLLAAGSKSLSPEPLWRLQGSTAQPGSLWRESRPPVRV